MKGEKWPLLYPCEECLGDHPYPYSRRREERRIKRGMEYGMEEEREGKWTKKTEKEGLSQTYKDILPNPLLYCVPTKGKTIIISDFA